jgi:transposase
MAKCLDKQLKYFGMRRRLGMVRYAERHGTHRPWLVQLLAKRPTKVATVDLANKIARTAWAIMTSGESYREPERAAA